MRIFLSVIILIIIAVSCKPKAVDILKLKSDKLVSLAYTNSYFKGFTVPSENEFVEIELNSQNYIGKYYKIYYQNESYKFNDTSILAYENFYGSWVDTDVQFKKINSANTLIKFQIKGNPRNEEKYFTDNRVFNPSQIQVDSLKAAILTSIEWSNAIKAKAKVNNISLDDQLEQDAKWKLKYIQANKKRNNRWQRNLRVGTYSLLVVVIDSSDIEQLPNYIKNISLKDTTTNKFVNPYAFFAENEWEYKTDVIKLNNLITVKAVPPIDKGVYVEYNKFITDTSYYNKYVNSSLNLDRQSAFAYYPNKRTVDKPIQNLAVRTKILSQNFSYENYKENIENYGDSRVETYFTNSNSPGKSFGVNTENNSLWFKNPKNEKGEFIKENIGVKTRNGFTYGKITYKIKMAELLNKQNVWTGLTNALWLVTESDKEWNKRRVCNKEGYMPYYGAAQGVPRIPSISYSEIDFEIVKAAENWPKTSYPKYIKRKVEPESHINKVMIACTNFDMACKEPERFNEGIRKIGLEKDTFYIHRWDKWHNALTSKVPYLDDDLFSGEFFYFQIEWKPTEIIWRVGNDKKKLEVVGYMNDKVTNIPNNQMVCVITQEYHHSGWWPNSPFLQENIPFTAEDLNGILYSIEIE